MAVELDRLGEILELQSALDDRRPEKRRVGLAFLVLLPLTVLFLAVGLVFGGYMWWFSGLWMPVFGFGAYRWLRMVLADRRDAKRLLELGFEPNL